MTALEKVEFIIKTLKWSEKRFTRKFYLKSDSLENWRHGNSAPNESDVKNICKYFHLNTKDFLNNDRIIFLKNADKFCNFSMDEENTISEDFPKEDNSRYEEKD